MSDSPSTHTSSQEKIVSAFSGWFMLLFNFALLAAAFYLIIQVVPHTRGAAPGWPIFTAIGLIVLAAISFSGFFTLQPNESRVLILFGSYHGTVRHSGFFWANPFYSRARAQASPGSRSDAADAIKGLSGASALRALTASRSLSAKISLRARNFNSEKLKVNDKRGNPIEIAAVIVWRVEDTAKAAFDVDDFESYVQTQSESALRHVASLYSYDRSEDDHEPTLRDSADEVARELQNELLVRLAKAGVKVDEARLTHLAYAPEIAQAMLRRQQAEAVIAARTKIVHGAVSMVEMALKELFEKGVVMMDEERKAAMVSNLLVVLCGESEVSPVVNTGTLYN